MTLQDLEGEIARIGYEKRLWFSTPHGDNGYTRRTLRYIYDTYKDRLGAKAAILSKREIIEVPYRAGSPKGLAALAAEGVAGKSREEILRDMALFLDREWYAQNGLKWRRGILLYGPPGNGKTVTTKMMAGWFLDAGVTAFQLNISSYMSGDDLQIVLRTVSKFKPSLLIIEDFESILEADLSRNELLTILDDTQENGVLSGVFLVATTNYPEKLDKAIIGRSGRFDKTCKVDLPQAVARKAYLGSLQNSHLYRKFHQLIGTKTAGLPMAALNELHYQILSAGRSGEVKLGEFIVSAIERIKTVEKAKRTEKWREEDPGIGFRNSNDEP